MLNDNKNLANYKDFLMLKMLVLHFLVVHIAKILVTCKCQFVYIIYGMIEQHIN